MTDATVATTGGAPARELQWARWGEAYFARKLNELMDEEFNAPTLLDGWRRREIIAHIGYNARALARLMDWATTGVPTPMYPSRDYRDQEIAYGATLNPLALRSLCSHAAVHLNVEWRDASDSAWDAPVQTATGRSVTAAFTPWMRAREVWVHAVDLDNGGSFVDFPPDFIDALLREITDAWRARSELPDVLLAPSDRGYTVSLGPASHVSIAGTAADLTRWATGRGARRMASSIPIPAAPHWL